MNSKSKRITTIVTWLLIVVTNQVLVGAGIAAPNSGELASTPVVQVISGVLATSGNKPVMVNGQSAITGATIVSGATVETPDQVKATIAIPGHGSVVAEGNTKFAVSFGQTDIKITLIQGCLVLVTMKGTSGEIDNEQTVLGKTDGLTDGRLEVCPKRTPGAVAAAAGGAGGLFGLGAAATVAIIGGGIAAVVIPIATHGGNPSPASP
jgi:hypothetical protein